jgi:hypothetical protein
VAFIGFTLQIMIPRKPWIVIYIYWFVVTGYSAFVLLSSYTYQFSFVTQLVSLMKEKKVLFLKNEFL